MRETNEHEYTTTTLEALLARCLPYRLRPFHALITLMKRSSYNEMYAGVNTILQVVYAEKTLLGGHFYSYLAHRRECDSQLE